MAGSTCTSPSPTTAAEGGFRAAGAGSDPDREWAGLMLREGYRQ